MRTPVLAGTWGNMVFVFVYAVIRTAGSQLHILVEALSPPVPPLQSDVFASKPTRRVACSL